MPVAVFLITLTFIVLIIINSSKYNGINESEIHICEDKTQRIIKTSKKNELDGELPTEIIRNQFKTKTTNTTDNSSILSIIKYILVIFILFTIVTCGSRKRIGAKCKDGASSFSTNSGTCSHHNGVRSWKYKYWWD